MVGFFRSRSLRPFDLPEICKASRWRRIRRCGFSVQAAESMLACSDSPEVVAPGFDSRLYGCLLRRCVQNNDPLAAMAIHSDILKKGNCLDLFATNILLDAYVKAGRLSDAVKVFDEMSERNTVSFVTLFQGYTLSDTSEDAVGLFTRLHREGHELNQFAFSSFMKLLVSLEMAEVGFWLHAPIVKLGHDSNAFVGTALVDAYSLCGCVDSARKVFEGILHKDNVAWTGIISCYAENAHFEDSLELLSRMAKAGFKLNNYTFAAALKASLGLGAFDMARAIHGHILKSCHGLNIYVGVGLLELYTQLSDMPNALKIFDELPMKDVIHWSFLITRFAQSDHTREAMDLFFRMRRAFVTPNQFTLTSILQACATAKSFDFGTQIHGLVVKVGLESDVYVLNALMDVYAKCDIMGSAMKLFADSPDKNEVSWNTIIVGYAQSDGEERALSVFVEMLRNQVQVSEVTFSSSLRACASLAAFELGVQIHAETIKTGHYLRTVVGNALVDMYAKCGDIKGATFVFEEMVEKDVVSWNTMVSGYSTHGLVKEALKIFEEMKGSGCIPNGLTFVGILSGCSNAGLLDLGQGYFRSMVRDFGIEPFMEHYTCMVWLLGRSGQLDKAMKLIEEIPHEPTIMVWRAMLGASVIQKSLGFARKSAEQILRIDPKDEATYVLLSNMYAGAKKWADVASTRRRMRENGVSKEPGLSWIEHQGSVHYFSVGSSSSHPDKKLINGMLEWLNIKTRQAGYAPDRSVIVLDMDDDEKDRRLWVHSERLALAFGLVRMPSRNLLRIIKNLRICSDCHNVMKLISKIVQRDLVIRDMNRFHHFHQGECSCGDYW
ncbi:PREDICTED: putative pentatricopeptide repeat-containing protein At5g13230, mitochondrial [Tarenaya hassleriana]|uniref:putative pentatricopeptide repeat-containing protein At5g13230, mitochondrial n=1 Tax=Tarenaya hassleriana TaxID=28532 RepID=UPI00053C5F0B|nr:PREDICTED: putative pentatricopeptide repeat-containing protein At5g13230, mitochondrial [Tarenaya hassleriana]